MTRPVTGRPPPALDREPLTRDTLEAARALIGALLVRDDDRGSGRRVGRIVEVEAYIGSGDRASHARMGPTPRNRVMFGPPGIVYVYLVYGMHHCLNVVTEPDQRPAAVLIRAVEPLEGLAGMRAARGLARPGGRCVRDARLASGPGLVCSAFGIDRAMTGLDLCDPSSHLRLEPRPDGIPVPEVVAAPRIGIGYAGEPWISRPWRLLDPASPSLSRVAP